MPLMRKRGGLEEVVAAGCRNLDVLQAMGVHDDVVLVPEGNGGHVPGDDLLDFDVVGAIARAIG